MQIKKIGILYHPAVQTAIAKAREFRLFLTSRNVESWECSAWETSEAVSLLDGTDLLVTVGGDGTILRASQIAMSKGIPIVGINMGNLGFLTELKADEAQSGITSLLEGNGWVDERMMLEAEVEGGEYSGEDRIIYHALNDIVLARGEIVKLIQIEAVVDGKPLTNYRADGVILSTSTGSTSYAMAAGGPILYPSCLDIVMVPISTHLSMSYSLVLPGSSVISLRAKERSKAVMSIDGHINLKVTPETIITVRRSSHKTRFLRLNPQTNFFNVLEEKFRGLNH